ncbi:hypothetical protein DPMN_038647 [Dreissena polymorpha]|uniref:Uncharacterized protein n=1 Tax=Dreissena polymorpha TaxID=45954 RepID=A0A9D4RQH5_DREPO|nr:hypothetical protein DPMN_038647 [Dreissena polymorpha]
MLGDAKTVSTISNVRIDAAASVKVQHVPLSLVIAPHATWDGTDRNVTLSAVRTARTTTA